MIAFASILSFFKKLGFFILDNWKVVLPIVAVLVLTVFVYRACNRPPKLDEKQIQKAEQAIKDRNDKALKEILADSDTRVDNIDSNIKQAEQNTRDAVKSYENYTLDELAAEIERRK